MPQEVWCLAHPNDTVFGACAGGLVHPCHRRHGVLHIPMTLCLVHVMEGWCLALTCRYTCIREAKCSGPMVKLTESHLAHLNMVT